MLQPQDSRFGSIKRCTLKNFTVFLNAIVRLTTHPGLVSLFTDPKKRKQGEKEKARRKRERRDPEENDLGRKRKGSGTKDVIKQLP